MSIIVLESEHRLAEETVQDGASPDSAVRELLDHVAAELAAEYIRLMERAAEAKVCAPRLDQGDHE